MFTAALFTIAGTWKQPKYPSTEEWMRRCGIYWAGQKVHSDFSIRCNQNPNEHVGPHNIYNGILLSYKMNEIMPFLATWLDLEIVTLSEVSQTEKDKYHMILLICGI